MPLTDEQKKANKFERMRILQRLIDYAVEPRISHIFWYPIRKEPNGTLHYGKCEIIEPHYHAALRALRLVIHELQSNGGATGVPPVNQREER